MGDKSHLRLTLILLIAGGTILALFAHSLFPNQRITIWIVFVGFCVVLFCAALFTYLQPERKFTPQKDVVDIFIKIASSALLVASLFIAWFSLTNTQLETSKNLELSQAALENSRIEQRSQRFMEALEKLGGTTIHERLAGIHGFQKLDSEFKSNEEFYEGFYNRWKDSLASQTTGLLANLEEKRKAEIKEHSQIMDILTKFIRTQAPWQDKPEQADPPPRDDVETILRYLAERKLTYLRGETEPLNLSESNLSGYKLNRTMRDNCDEPEARKVNFEEANFSEANLNKIELKCAKLRKAVFWNAHLKGATLENADLTGADLTGTHLEGANLTGATVRQEDFEAAIVDKDTSCPRPFKIQPECSDDNKPETCKCVKE